MERLSVEDEEFKGKELIDKDVFKIFYETSKQLKIVEHFNKNQVKRNLIAQIF